MNLYDEAIVLVGAMRVGAGEVPHRDFYSNYGPAPYYLLAGLFKLFGTSFTVARLYDSLVKAALIGSIFYVVSRATRPGLGISASGIALVWLVADGAYLYVIFPVMLLGILATWMLRPDRTGGISVGRAMVSGALTGSTALFRYDSAGGLAIFLGAAVALLILPKPGGVRAFVRTGGAYIIGCAVVFVPAATLFLLHVPYQSFAFDVFGFNARLYLAMRRLPWPGLSDLAVNVQDLAIYLPLTALVMTAVHLLWPPKSRSNRDRATALLFSAMTVAFTLKGLVRVSIAHMMMAIIGSVILLALLAEQFVRRNTYAARMSVTAGAAAVGVLAATSLSSYLGSPLFARSPAIFSAPPVTPGYLPPPYGEAAAYVASKTKPGERIFVGRFHHDRLLFNAVILYFATGRLPATHWHQFDPGLQTSAPIQRQMIEEFEHGNTRWLLLENWADDLREPNGSANSSGVMLLDNYIHAHYRLDRNWGEVQAWSRK